MKKSAASPLGLVLTLTLSIGAAAATLPSCGSSTPAHGTGSGGAGGGHPMTDGGHDASDAPSDATDGGGDASDASTAGIRCSKLLSCDQVCTTTACTNACYAEATGVAQGLFDAFTSCIAANCPSLDGGPCASSSSAACSSCNQSAATGACISKLVACEQDVSGGPADPDGGGVVFPDAGTTYNCGELNTCVAGCETDGGSSCENTCKAHATPEATVLEDMLQSCLATACPAADGGPCAMPGLACNGCIEQVTLTANEPCAAPYVACNSDTSNSPDGGSTPTSLVDGGALSTVLTGIDSAASNLVVQGSWLYFTEVLTGGTVYRLSIGDPAAVADGGLSFGDGGIFTPDGGAVLESVGPAQPTPVSIAVDANNVYVWSVGTFALNSSTNNHDGTVVQIPLGGGPAITLFQGMEVFYDAPYLNAIAVDSTYVYWVAGATGNDGAIMRAPIGGGTATAIFSGQQLPEALTTDGTNVYWANWGTFNAQGDSNNDGTVWEGSINGGTAMKLAGSQSPPATIAVDANNVYWVDLGPLGADNFPALSSGSVLKTPIGGGGVTTIASTQSVAYSLVVQGGNVYWTDYGLSVAGVIMAAPAAGGTPVALVTGLDDPSAMAIGSGTLYWANANSSSAGFISALAPF